MILLRLIETPVLPKRTELKPWDQFHDPGENLSAQSGLGFDLETVGNTCRVAAIRNECIFKLQDKHGLGRVNVAILKTFRVAHDNTLERIAFISWDTFAVVFPLVSLVEILDDTLDVLNLIIWDVLLIISPRISSRQPFLDQIKPSPRRGIDSPPKTANELAVVEFTSTTCNLLIHFRIFVVPINGTLHTRIGPKTFMVLRACGFFIGSG